MSVQSFNSQYALFSDWLFQTIIYLKKRISTEPININDPPGVPYVVSWLYRPRRERGDPGFPPNRCQRAGKLLKSFLENGEGMFIEKRRAIPINSRPVVIELDVTGAEALVISILMETEHEVPLGFDPVDAVIFVVNTGGIPEANFQSCVLNVVTSSAP
ncbi:hypothetical protein [Haloglomus irregulare]|jgi:hypothetical protein|uniref:hypothetical protein n=1 Tax=Haloglomus irregulare TaxID=2234134 RepID=UPI00163D4F5C|nr:hypothetical protein [Haloglomus irregulare]